MAMFTGGEGSILTTCTTLGPLYLCRMIFHRGLSGTESLFDNVSLRYLYLVPSCRSSEEGGSIDRFRAYL